MALHRVAATGLPVVDVGALDVERPGNVVAPLTSFIGRGDVLAGVLGGLDAHRLVTLIGVGGVGKTRLALEAALEARGFQDGVWLVELGLIDAVTDVASAMSDALRLRPTPGVSYDESVVEWCSSRNLLVVLDNCEHVLRGAESLVGSLMASAPGVKVLATSREPLMVAGEHVVPVPSLSLSGSAGDISEAVEFFVERSRAELPDFDALGQEEAVGDICARLDGIPLALELAASRVRGLSIPEISRRLDERFRLLTGGRSGSVERHATLRAAIDWSYDLLEPEEQDLFQRLAVFAGRFAVDDAVGLGGKTADEFEVIDTLTALVDRSLVVREDQLPEYRMLETLRAYGRERLALDNRIDDVRADHAMLMAGKANKTRASAAGPAEAAVTALLEAQLPDYGAAADWAIGAERPELAVAIAEDCLVAHWGIEEPGRWIATLIRPDQPAAPWMAGALAVAAQHALFFENEPLRGAELAHRATVLDPTNALAYGQACIAAMFTGQQDSVVEHGQKARETATDDNELHMALLVLSHALLIAGRLEEAGGTARDLERLGDSRQYPSAIASARYIKGQLIADADPRAALVEFQAGLDALDGIVDWSLEANLRRESIPALMRTEPQGAIRAAADLLELCDQRNDTGQVNYALAYLVTILHDLGDLDLATKVAGRVGDLLLPPTNAAQYNETTRSLRQQLGDRYDQLIEGGERSPTKDIVEAILDALSCRR